MSRRKEAPVVPVVGGTVVASSGDREEQMRKWEEEQAQRRASAAQPAPVAMMPAPTAPAPTDPNATQAPSVLAAAAGEEAAAVPATPARSAAAGYLPMPEFAEPDSSDPEARLEFYSRGIMAVQYAARANHERAEQQRLIGLGVRLKAIKEEELHKTAGFDTFGDLTDARFGIKKHQANNIIRVLGVAQALEDMTTQELKERPLRVLVPILETHGAEAVQATWREASRHGNVTDTALKQAANFLGYGPPKELNQALESGQKETGKAADKPSESLRAVERIRTLAQRDLELARREAEQLESAVRELLEELAGNLE